MIEGSIGAQLCEAVSIGHTTFSVLLPLSTFSRNPLSSATEEGSVVKTISVIKVQGCSSSNAEVSGIFSVDTVDYDISCPVGGGKCSIYTVVPIVPDNIVATSSSGRRLLTDNNDEDESSRVRRRLEFKEQRTEIQLEGGHIIFNTTYESYSEEHGHRQLWWIGYSDPFCFIGLNRGDYYYQWCQVPFLSQIQSICNSIGLGWAFNAVFSILQTFGLSANSNFCVSNWNLYLGYWPSIVNTCNCRGNCGSCFPVDAEVLVLQEGNNSSRVTPMRDVQYGDKVQIMTSSGELTFGEVYVFGHRDENKKADYVNIETALNHLKMSLTHYARICKANCDTEGIATQSIVLESVYAKDVIVGDIVAEIGEGSAVALGRVEKVWVSEEQGLYNPYIRGGDIVVNGIVASVHSAWLLDTPDSDSFFSFLPSQLSVIYEWVLFPVYCLFKVIGPLNSRNLAEWLGVHGDRASTFNDFFALLVVYSMTVLPIYHSAAYAKKKLYTNIRHSV